MRIFSKALGIGAITYLLNAGVAYSESITWTVTPFPPLFLTEGSLKDQGMGDRLMDLLEEQMPQYKHSTEVIPYQRYAALMKQGKNYCNVAFIKTPDRESLAYFSMPALFGPPNGLIFLKENQAKFGDKVHSLKHILSNTKIKIGVAGTRRYGGEIDKIIAANADNPRLMNRKGKSSLTGLLRMLEAGRFDAVIGFPNEAMYDMRQGNAKKKFEMARLEEADKIVVGRVACTKNAWGKKVIENVNKVLLAERKKETYREFIYEWYTDRYLKYVKQFYDGTFLKDVE